MIRTYRVVISFLILYSLVILGCQSKEESNQQELPLDRTSSTGTLTYKVPDAWKEEAPSSSMRIAQYRLPGIEGADDAELAVFVFPGSGGGVQANIDRWIGQFKQPDGSDSKDKTEVKNVKSNGLPVSIIYVTGTHLKGSMMGGPTTELKNYAMIAAIVETSTDPWFFKTVGPEKTIKHWQSEFENFAKTFKQE
jgi:hypothetical protein